MSSTPREIGTLIVVVLKANHLPNKRHIGKQDPYCVVEVNGEKRRTKAIRRGGQHPEWDEEIRFTLFEDVNDMLERTANNDKTLPPLPSKDDKDRKVKGGKIMKLSCFADDAREPDLIGEADVDLTEVLTKGETDEWFTLMNKDKFSGKVYLELTFWSNAPPPEKKVTTIPAKNKQYAGPGSFIPSEGPSLAEVNGSSHSSRAVSASGIHDHYRQTSDSIPASLRPSSSLAKLDLYVPPYEQKSRLSSVDPITNEFKELGVLDHIRRRESFPPPSVPHTARPNSPSNYSTFRSHASHVYEQSISDTATYSYDAPPGQSHYDVQVSYRSQYEPLPSAYHQSLTNRAPRPSIPTTSSGFMPLTHASDSTGFNPPALAYNSPQFHPPTVYGSQTPVPPNTDAYLSSSSSFIPQQSFPQSQSFQYMPTLPTSTISQPYSPISQQQLPLSQTVPQQTYQGYAPTPSPSRDTRVSLSSSTSVPPSLSIGSRPLPQQPQVAYSQQVPAPYPVPPPNGLQNSFTNTQPGNSALPTNNMYQPPPPPPPPPIQYSVDQPSHLFISTSHVTNGFPTPPPPPPPPLHLFPSTSSGRQLNLPQLPDTPSDHNVITGPLPSSSSQVIPSSSSRRHSGLPQPPILYHQSHNAYQPPLPPPLLESRSPSPLPPLPQPLGQKFPYHPGPTPNPPVQVDVQGQWIPSQTVQARYMQNGFV